MLKYAWVLALGFAALGQARASEVDCTAWFEATWSSTSHPDNFPGGAHFSPLIGATHDATTRLWRPGELASPGIQDVAERGATGRLNDEIDDAVNQGTARAAIRGPGLGTPDQVAVDFVMSTDFPLLSLVTMIAPSPDWFIGVYDLVLFDNGRWQDHHVELLPWDAGTDSGLNYTSSNEATVPPEFISLLTTGDAGNGEPFGSLTVVCDGVFLSNFD